MLITDFSNQDTSVLKWIRSFNFNTVGIVPESFGSGKINAMFTFVTNAFVSIPLKIHTDMIHILC